MKRLILILLIGSSPAYAVKTSAIKQVKELMERLASSSSEWDQTLNKVKSSEFKVPKLTNSKMKTYDVQIPGKGEFNITLENPDTWALTKLTQTHDGDFNYLEHNIQSVDTKASGFSDITNQYAAHFPEGKHSPIFVQLHQKFESPSITLTIENAGNRLNVSTIAESASHRITLPFDEKNGGIMKWTVTPRSQVNPNGPTIQIFGRNGFTTIYSDFEPISGQFRSVQKGPKLDKNELLASVSLVPIKVKPISGTQYLRSLGIPSPDLDIKGTR